MESMSNTTADFAGLRVAALESRRADDMKRLIERKLVMGIADASMQVDGREIYTAKDLRVGLFTSTKDF